MCPLVATQLEREIHSLFFILSELIQLHVHDKVKVKKKVTKVPCTVWFRKIKVPGISEGVKFPEATLLNG